MKVAELLDSRRENWRELERLCVQLESRSKRKLPGNTIARFAAMYRSACADLALADAYQLPQQTVSYLHHLVGRAHNQLYRSRKFNVKAWSEMFLVEVPQLLFRDNCVRLAFVLFYGFFLISLIFAAVDTKFAEQVVGRGMLEQMDNMHSNPVGGNANVGNSSFMASFYIQHNTSIGLRVFVMGVFFGVLGLFETVYNACVLGSVFGYMTTTNHWKYFYEFVTAHGPFELNAIVISAAAGMRMGFSIIDTKGWSRKSSVKRASRQAVPVMILAVVLFFLAAFVEGFISPSPLPWEVKIGVALISVLVMVFYFVVLGYPRR